MIRKRVTRKVSVHEDAAIRVALRYAISRQGELLKDLDESRDEDQDDIAAGKERIKTWERFLSIPGQLRIVAEGVTNT